METNVLEVAKNILIFFLTLLANVSAYSPNIKFLISYFWSFTVSFTFSRVVSTFVNRLSNPLFRWCIYFIIDIVASIIPIMNTGKSLQRRSIFVS